MSTFDKRQQAFENKFFHDATTEFKVVCRRRKLAGLWAAEKMHLDDEDALEYALEIVRSSVGDNSYETVIKRIYNDMQKAGLNLTEKEISKKISRFHRDAEEQIAEGK